jgi:hypothetical protein
MPPALRACLFLTLWKLCISTNEWINKMWYIHTMEYYLAIRKNYIMSFAGKWMELEIIMLIEISQSEKQMPSAFSYAESRAKNIKQENE